MKEANKKAQAGKAKKEAPAGNGEPVYSAGELARCAAKVFGPGVRSECVRAALRNRNKESASVPEAKRIVETFMRKEIK